MAVKSQPVASADDVIDVANNNRDHSTNPNVPVDVGEGDVHTQDGCICCFCCCCRCCCPETKRIKHPIKLWDDGRLLKEDVEIYKARVESVRHLPQLIAGEVYECCKHDLDRRITLLLEMVTDLDWLPHFCELTEKHMTSPLVFALSRESNKVARVLTNAGREMIMITLPPGPYEGATALHLAVLNNSKQTVAAILEPLNYADRLKLMNQQATGSFFGETDGIGQVQVLAAACGSIEIFLQLAEYGGDIDCINASNGYSVIHALVDYGFQEPARAIAFMEEVLEGEHSLRWYCKQKGLNMKRITKEQKLGLKQLLLKIENFEGYTPITYAAKINAHKMLLYIIHTEGVYKHTAWKMGPKSLAMYDMAEIDSTVASMMNPKRPNVLDQLLYSGDADHLPSLCEEPLLSLMEFKWSIVKIIYYIWALCHIGLMSGLTYMSIIRTDFLIDIIRASQELNLTIDETIMLLEKHNIDLSSAEQEEMLLTIAKKYEVCKAFAILFITFYLLFELYDALLALKLFVRGRLWWQKCGYYKAASGVIKKSDEFDIIVMGFALSACAWFAAEYLHHWDEADILIALTLVSGWYFALFFARAYPPTSYFTLMVNRILFTDLLRFGLIMIFIIIGFAAAIKSLLILPPPENFTGMVRSIETMFYVMVGSSDLGFVSQSKNITVTTIFAIVYVIIATISMLNMLIAAMSDTYVSISENKDSTARTLRVRSGMIIERRTPNVIMSRLLMRSMTFDGTYLLPVHEVIKEKVRTKQVPNLLKTSELHSDQVSAFSQLYT